MYVRGCLFGFRASSLRQKETSVLILFLFSSQCTHRKHLHFKSRYFESHITPFVRYFLKFSLLIANSSAPTPQNPSNPAVTAPTKSADLCGCRRLSYVTSVLSAPPSVRSRVLGMLALEVGPFESQKLVEIQVVLVQPARVGGPQKSESIFISNVYNLLNLF